MPHLARRLSTSRSFRERVTLRYRQAGSRADDGAWTEGGFRDIDVDCVSMPSLGGGTGGVSRKLMPAGARESDIRWFFVPTYNIQTLRYATDTGGPSGADVIQRGGVDYLAWTVMDESGGDYAQNNYRKILGVKSDAVSGTRSYAAVDTALRKWVRKGTGLAAGYVIDLYDDGPVPGGAFASAKLTSARLQGSVQNVLVGANMRVRAHFIGNAELRFCGPGSTDRSLKFVSWASSDAGQTSADAHGLTIHEAEESVITAQPMGSEYEDEATVAMVIGFTAEASSAEKSFASGTLVIWNSERTAAEPAVNLTGGTE